MPLCAGDGPAEGRRAPTDMALLGAGRRKATETRRATARHRGDGHGTFARRVSLRRGKAMQGAEISPHESPLFPHPVSGFVGRERELARVRSTLPREPLFLVYGVAGIGKSELVYKLVEEARALPALS